MLTLVEMSGSDMQRSQFSSSTEGKLGLKSTLAVANVIYALSESKKHIPYRDHQLTRLLKNALANNSHTCWISCLNSCESVESLNTLKIGEMVGSLSNCPRKLEALPFEGVIKAKKDQGSTS